MSGLWLHMFGFRRSTTEKHSLKGQKKSISSRINLNTSNGIYLNIRNNFTGKLPEQPILSELVEYHEWQAEKEVDKIPQGQIGQQWVRDAPHVVIVTNYTHDRNIPDYSHGEDDDGYTQDGICAIRVACHGVKGVLHTWGPRAGVKGTQGGIRFLEVFTRWDVPLGECCGIIWKVCGLHLRCRLRECLKFILRRLNNSSPVLFVSRLIYRLSFPSAMVHFKVSFVV